MPFLYQLPVRLSNNVKVVSCEFVDIVQHFHSRSNSCVIACRILKFGEMDVEIFSENEQDENKLDDDVLVDFVHQKGNESAHD